MEQAAARRGQELAQAILKETGEARMWGKLLKSEDENIQLKAMQYLSDRAYGKATQAVTVETHEGHKFGFDNPSNNGERAMT